MTRRRPYYSAMIAAALMVERGRPQEAVRQLEGLLADAPPGFVAWTLPVEPLLRPLHAHPAFRASSGNSQRGRSKSYSSQYFNHPHIFSGFFRRSSRHSRKSCVSSFVRWDVTGLLIFAIGVVLVVCGAG